MRNIGFVFQAYNLIPVLTARENVEFVMQVQGVSARERRQKSMDILREVGLSGMEHRRPAELSGGQQQRVAVARALVADNNLLLIDEPSEGLAPIVVQEVKHTISRLKEMNLLILLAGTTMAGSIMAGKYTSAIIHLLDRVLLALMLAEIIYTVGHSPHPAA